MYIALLDLIRPTFTTLSGDLPVIAQMVVIPHDIPVRVSKSLVPDVLRLGI